MQSLYQKLIDVGFKSLTKVVTVSEKRHGPNAEWVAGSFGWVVLESSSYGTAEIMAELMPIDGTRHGEERKCKKFSLDIYSKSYRTNERRPNTWWVTKGRIIEENFSEEELSDWIERVASNALVRELLKLSDP